MSKPEQFDGSNENQTDIDPELHAAMEGIVTAFERFVALGTAPDASPARQAAVAQYLWEFLGMVQGLSESLLPKDDADY